MMRTCRHCHETKPFEEFVKNTRYREGRTYICKPCRAAVSRKWRADNPERNHALMRKAHRRLSVDAELAFATKYRRQSAKERGATIVEDVSPLIVLERDDGVCGICGEDVDPFAFEIDHIVPCADGGDHSYENVQLAHRRCNVLKYFREDRVAA